MIPPLPRFLLLFLCSAAGAFAQLGGGNVLESVVPPEMIPPSPALTPEQALKSFKLAPGIRLEVAASEPLVQEPVAIAFSPDGRMWVVEMRGYMPDLDGNGEDAPVGRIVVLSDTDGDGRYDRAKTFVDQLILPRAILLVGDGALVVAPPELVHWRDTNGDGVADEKVVVATDAGVRTDPKRPYLANPEHGPNNLVWGFDNWIYSAEYTRKFRYNQGRWEMAPTESRGQWGLGQDDAGRLYFGGNSNPLRCDVILSEYLRRNPNYPSLSGDNVTTAPEQFVWPARVTPGINRGYLPEMYRDHRLKSFTAAGGASIYRGDVFPEFYGNAFVAEPGANLVRRAVLSFENGAIRSRNAYDQQEFIASTDERFRPVNFATGPDGGLYVVDLYRGVLQHRISLTVYLRKQSEQRGLADPQHLGRIYRVLPTDRPAARTTPAAPTTMAQWVERLSHANGWWRQNAQRILVERGDRSVVPAVLEIATSSPQALSRLHALWTLEGMNVLERPAVLTALHDRDPLVRIGGLRMSERFLKEGGSENIAARVVALLRDASPEVQLQAVLAAGEIRDRAVDLTTAEVVRAHPKNVFLRDALFSGLHGREFALFERLIAERGWSASDAEANRILSGLARGIAGSRELKAIEGVMAAAAAAHPKAPQRAAAIADGLAAAGSALRRPLTFPAEPAGWLALQKNAAYATRLAKFEPLVQWPGKPGLEKIPPVKPLTAAEQTRFETGKTIFALCSACHQPTGRGLEGIAPPLVDSEWVLGSTERLVRVVLQGLRGEITVLGRKHSGDMPGLGATLDDEQVASVLTYIRREWGHTASPVAPAEVRAIRTATADRADAWTSGEFPRAVPETQRKTKEP